MQWNEWPLFEILPEQSEPWWPILQVHCPIVKSQCPFPLQGSGPSPGHNIPASFKLLIMACKIGEL